MGNNGPWVAMMMIVATTERIQGNVQLPVGDHRWKNCVPRIASQVFPIIFINIRIIDMNIRKVFPIIDIDFRQNGLWNYHVPSNSLFWGSW